MNDNDVIYASYCRGFSKAVSGTPLDGYDYSAFSGNSDAVAKAIAALALGVSDGKGTTPSMKAQAAVLTAITALFA